MEESPPPPEENHTGETSGSRSPRFTMWVAFLVFSVITLWSAVGVKNDKAQEDSNAKWAVASSSVTFILTIVVCGAHLHPLSAVFFVGTKVEGTLCIILAAFWAATVSIVSNANDGLAVTHSSLQSDTVNTVINGNLYYFSWAGFVTSIVICVSYMRSAFGVDVVGEIQSRSARLTLWSGMLACAIVVLGSSANIFNKECDSSIEFNDYNDTLCRRTRFAISVGAIGTILSVGVVGIKLVTSTASFALEALFSFILVILNGFGVAYITSAKGPGSPIGNLYYFSWLSFLVSFMLIASCFEDYKSNEMPQSTDGGQGDPNSDIQIENLGDDQI